ncbi:hypothetical protein LZ480_00150 [Solibacillus sp. MA9]|uniref:Uncharacterized protein n=2 Tax=Solibacillus palustris TaxID=2908203 RepID=A0ABS9U7I5_9BACL|nr:hypothetical protein [Solibacillus sp. MA9]
MDIAIIPENKLFDTFKTGEKRDINSGAFERIHDTEYKLLATLANKLELQKEENCFKGDLIGNIELYTRKIPCLSCDFVLIQFNRMYPRISIKVYYEEN